MAGLTTLIAAPPKDTPFVDSKGRITVPWLAWLQSVVTTGQLVAQISGSGALLAANNLSDVASASLSRTHLGLGSAALLAASAVLQASNNLSDLASVSAARTNLGLGSAALSSAASFDIAGAAAAAQAASCQKSSNLSDVSSAATSLSNLVGSWQSYTPTVSGDGTLTVSALSVTDCKYLQLGPLVVYRFEASMTIGGSTAGSHYITISLPVTGAGNMQFMGVTSGNASAGGWGPAVGFINASSLNLYQSPLTGGWNNTTGVTVGFTIMYR